MTFHQPHSVSGQIFMSPLKFQGEAAPLGQAFHVAVTLGLSHSNASQPLTLPYLSFKRVENLSRKKWLSYTVQRALTPDTVRMPVFSFTCSCLNCDIRERERKSESVLAHRNFSGTLKTSLQKVLIRSLCSRDQPAPTVDILSWQRCGSTIENYIFCVPAEPLCSYWLTNS